MASIIAAWIGFLLCGIRARDTELLEPGLTLPGFMERSKQIAFLPNRRLLTLAGMTPKHHEYRYIEVPDLSSRLTAVSLDDRFDLVAISSYSAQIDEEYELAMRFRAAGTPVVLGGPHVTALPHEARKATCSSIGLGRHRLNARRRNHPSFPAGGKL
jgi:hypothetical protein